MNDKIIELEAVLKAAADLVAEMQTANNALKVQSPHVAALRSRILGSQDNLAAHQQWLAVQPPETTAAKPT
jgi:hypothetical protein